MGAGLDPLGHMLVAAGILSEAALEELLQLQKQRVPLASLAHHMGLATEESLVRQLSKQAGVPGVVLSRSTIDLGILSGISRELASQGLVLPLVEDHQRIFCACAHPETGGEFLRQIAFIKGKPVVPHVALHSVLLRTIRETFGAARAGHSHYAGSEADSGLAQSDIFVVSEVDTVPPGRMEALAVEAVMEDVTKEVSVTDFDGSSWGAENTHTTQSSIGFAEGSEQTTPINSVRAGPEDDGTDELDGADPALHAARSDRPSVLIVDDDVATSNLLVKELGPDGYQLLTAGTGGEAVRILESNPPSAVIIDVMLPQIDGFQVCRSMKNSVKYRHIPVILMSAVIDSGRVTDEVLQIHGADAYFEKPLNTSRLRNQLRSLLVHAQGGSQPADDGSFDRALQLYRAGELDQAIDALRRGLEVDPLSARHHFVLANLLQKQSLIYEAIDEYETTVDLMPDYFPALTRLAYLYYKKGFSAKAIETWRRALPHCTDPGLRKNIEVFMRKLIADMQGQLGR